VFLVLHQRYFFVVTNYFLYGESIIYYFKVRDSLSPAAVLGRY
jgi:hypothetical protein